MTSDPNPAPTALHSASHDDSEKHEHKASDPSDSAFRFDTSPAVRYLTRRCGDRNLAEDIAQDALVTILAHESLREEWMSLRLLFRVAMNEFSNHQRKAASRSAHMGSIPAGEVGLLSDGCSIDIDLAIDVRDALGRLQPEPRRLILLYWEGYSYIEMAQALDISVAALRMRLMRAKEEFVAELSEYRLRRGQNSAT